MKANKAKTSNKAVKKVDKQLIKKELETSISAKFLDVLKGMGHDAEKFTKEIKKTSKALARKIAKKYKEVKVVVGEKLESNVKVKPLNAPVKKTVSAPRKAITSAVKKAEKIVTSVQKTKVPVSTPARKKSAVSRKSPAIKSPETAVVAEVKKPAVKKTPRPKTEIKPVE